MKAELTPELKEKFFANYFWQNIMWFDGHEEEMGVFIVSQHAKGESIERAYLALRPLDQITDEEAVEAAKIIWGKESEKDMHTAEEGRRYLVYRRRPERKEYPALIDFLRSKGFAVPYMGHSVEELVSAGWVKLIERTDKPE